MTDSPSSSPYIFTIEWRVPPLDDLVSTVKKPEEGDAAKVKTRFGEYTAQVMAVSAVKDHVCTVMLAVSSDMKGEIEDVEFVD